MFKKLGLKTTLSLLAIFSLVLYLAPRQANRLAADYYSYSMPMQMPVQYNYPGNTGAAPIPSYQMPNMNYNYTPPVNFNNNYNNAAPYYSTNQYPTSQITQPASGNLVVVMGDNFFDPRSVNVQPGTTVTWMNQGTMAHTVTADNGMFDSGSIAPGGRFSFTFTNSGTFAYYCRFHGAPGGRGMAGTVTVTANSNSQNYNTNYPSQNYPNYNTYVCYPARRFGY